MKCEKCGLNEATTHIRSVVNGVVNEYNLCSSCAAKSGYKGGTHNSLAGMLSSMFGEFLNNGIPENTVKCPVCGATFSDIAKTGKVGCAECYKTFEAELMPYLKRVHGSTKHVGVVPNKSPIMVVEKEETVETLKLKLSQLVGEERYEEAAVIRDKIKELEGKK